MTHTRHTRSIAFLALLTVVALACGGGGTTDPPDDTGDPAGPASVSVSGAASVDIAATTQLTAQPRTSDGAAVDTGVTWSSSDDAVATVNASGLVTGVARGTVAITATVNGTSVSGTQELDVTVAAVSASVSADSMFSVGDTVVVTATAEDDDGAQVSGVPFTYTSSNPGVATVDGQGNVISTGNGGATITASVDGRSAEVEVGVRQIATSITVSPDAANIFASQTQEFAGTVRDARGNAIPGVAVTWDSDDATVAMVDGSGVAEGVDPGNATITATAVDGGFMDDATLTVTEPTLSGHVQPIFTANCALSGCHAGATPQEGQNLSAGQAWSNTVNVPSNQSSLDRIEPFEPDSSYLVHKILGTQGSVGGGGAQMPFGADPLSQAQIDLIRAWVARGAVDN